MGSPQVQVQVQVSTNLEGFALFIPISTLKRKKRSAKRGHQAVTKTAVRRMLGTYLTESRIHSTQQIVHPNIPPAMPHAWRTAGLMHRVQDACNVGLEREGLVDQVAAPLGSDTPRGRLGVLIRPRLSAGTHLAVRPFGSSPETSPGSASHTKSTKPVSLPYLLREEIAD